VIAQRVAVAWLGVIGGIRNRLYPFVVSQLAVDLPNNFVLNVFERLVKLDTGAMAMIANEMGNFATPPRAIFCVKLWNKLDVAMTAKGDRTLYLATEVAPAPHNVEKQVLCILAPIRSGGSAGCRDELKKANQGSKTEDKQ